MQKISRWWNQLAKDKKITIAFIAFSFVAIIVMTSINMAMPTSAVAVNKKEEISNTQETSKKQSSEVNKKVSENSKETIVPTPNGEEGVVKEPNKSVGEEIKETPKQEAPKVDTPTPPIPPSPEQPPIDHHLISVSIRVVGMNGTIANGVVEVKEGSSVFACLQQIIKQVKGTLHTSGLGKYVYVTGINDLHEKQHGANSGWVYTVNGISPNLGAGLYTVAVSDAITWTYIYE